jgi:hypothetical protein
MVLLPLDYLLIPVPAYDWATPLSAIAQAMNQPETVATGHVVVVDAQGHPLGVLPLGRLWSTHWGSASVAEPWGDGPLSNCLTWLEPAVTVMADQPLAPLAVARLRTLAQGSNPPPLVAVDCQGKYLGVLSPGPLLGWLAEQPSPGLRPLAPNSAATPLWPGQRAWVLELSHALKTPMTTLLGLSTLLLDSRVGSLSDRQFRYVSLMRQAIRKLTNLVNLLLDWMRLESGQIALNLERVNLATLGDELLPSFLSIQPEANAGDWVDAFAVDLAIPEAWVMADPLRLRQSLHYGLGYLLGARATPGGLVIEPWGPWLSITLWSATAIIQPGRPPENGPPSAPGVNGSAAANEEVKTLGLQSLEGLGLLVAGRLSHLHRGHLSQINTPTQGYRLTLLLPAPIGASDRSTVLIVLACDDHTLIDQVCGSLRESPYRVAVASSCEALITAQAQLAPLCTLLHWESLEDAPAGAAAQGALVQQLGIAQGLVLRSPGEATEATETTPGLTALDIEVLGPQLRPLLDRWCQPPDTAPVGGMTILVVREQAPGVLPAAVQRWLEHYQCRLLQVDDLPLASLLSRIWRPQAVIVDSGTAVSLPYLQGLARIPGLAVLPWVTLAPPAKIAPDPPLSPGPSIPTLTPCPEVLTQPPEQAAVNLLRAIAQARTVPSP